MAGDHERISQCGNVQELSQTVWAFATIGCEAKELFEAIAAQFERIAANGTVQQMSNIAWAFTKLGYEATELFAAVAGHIYVSLEN